MSWKNYLQGKGYFMVIDGIGFVRYAWMKKYSAFVVHEIGVAEEFKGKGYGGALLNAVPIPILLKCNEDNETGNAFYNSMGMKCAGRTFTKKGVPQLIWTLAARFKF